MNRTEARIVIGGTCESKDVGRFRELLKAEGVEWPLEQLRDRYPQIGICEDGTLRIEADEVPGGEFTQLELFCREAGLFYRRETAGCRSYDGEMEYWNPETEELWMTTADVLGDYPLYEHGLMLRILRTVRAGEAELAVKMLENLMGPLADQSWESLVPPLVIEKEKADERNT